MPNADKNGQAVENKATLSAQALKDLNWPTLVLIIFTGGTNFFATQKNNTDFQDQFNRAVRQVRDLHEALDETEKRQRTALNNQTQLLENDTALLKEVHRIVVQFEEWKRAEQNRGAPP